MDRAFFDQVDRIILVNPFSKEREVLDATLARTAEDSPDLIDRLVETVDAQLSKIDQRSLNGDDLERIRRAHLFVVFHRFAPRFDAHIEKQLKNEDAIEVEFAKEFLSDLRNRGLSAKRSQRALEVVFQMRRAWFFIGNRLIGSSSCMRGLRESLWNNVLTGDVAMYESHLWNRMEDFSTILVGETGTGKGAAAAALGFSSFIPWLPQKNRFAHAFTKTFVAINLSEYSDSLLESELFGHEKGAFTGAVQRFEGALSRCVSHGTVFLDEIGEVSEAAQIKLLRVLQDRVYSPVGSHEQHRFAGRVVAATHQSLDELRTHGRFRDDFYYRLCSDVIEVPPLRIRVSQSPQELTELTNSVLDRVVGQATDTLLQEELRERVHSAIAALGSDYHWPGNVRELEQCVRRVLLTGSCRADTKVSEAHGDSSFLNAVGSGTLDAKGLLAGYCAILYEKLGTYEAVAQLTGLDRRTVRKHVANAS